MTSPVRIFIEPSSHTFRNIGDAAMLEIAIERVRAFWPAARVAVHTLDAPTLRALDDSSTPLDPAGARAWSADVIVIGRSLAPVRALRRRLPAIARAGAKAALWWRRRDTSLLRHYLDAVTGSDLVLLSGAGSLNDCFKRQALVTLETLELAADAGAVTALLGQGIGPMSDRDLRQRAAAVLPRADFIGLREGIGSVSLLESLGVAADRFTVTGDDAIATAYRARRPAFGTAIGVNLRAAFYSGVGSDVIAGVGRVVRDVARQLGAPLLPVRISRDPEDDDLETARRMMGEDNAVDGRAAASTPAGLLALLPECRIVVAGSYHAAVFALSMGIPVVTIAASDYYIQKFGGLAAQFGGACRTLQTSQRDFYPALQEAVADTWRNAETARDGLLDATARQIALCEAAYGRVFGLVESRRAMHQNGP